MSGLRCDRILAGAVLALIFATPPGAMAQEGKEQAAQEAKAEGKKAVFKIPRTALLAIAFLVLCMTPVALGEFHWLAVIYVFLSGGLAQQDS